MLSLETIISMFVGGVITFIASRISYQLAGYDLRRTAYELKRLNHIMLFGMEQAGWIKLERGDNGEITGFALVISIPAVGAPVKIYPPSILPPSVDESKND